MLDKNFFRGKKILITGHTGFKGAWLCKVLLNFDADIIGYALEPTTEASLFMLANIEKNMTSIIGDIRDYRKLKEVFDKYQPEIVIHLAAQPIVRESYENPMYTYETNVMGTVNVCECVRLSDSVKVFLNVTTDKVYKNNEWVWGYRESDELNGYDPYSNSKSCSDIITSSYTKSFFNEKGIAVSIARAGNVIGGGDFAKDRIIPDCVRAVINKEKMFIRNPNSVRPYQHVLEPIMAYLLIIQESFNDIDNSGEYNVGPEYDDCYTTGQLVRCFADLWGKEFEFEAKKDNGPKESNCLRLDCSKIKSVLNWRPKWKCRKAIEETVAFTKVLLEGESIENCMDDQIKRYLEE